MIPRQGQLANLFLKVTDLGLMFCALSLAIIVNFSPENSQPVSVFAIDFFSSRIKVANALLCAIMVVIWYIIFNMQGIYRSHRLSTALDEVKAEYALGVACRQRARLYQQLGKLDSARLDLAKARNCFEAVGAAPEQAEVAREANAVSIS